MRIERELIFAEISQGLVMCRLMCERLALFREIVTDRLERDRLLWVEPQPRMQLALGDLERVCHMILDRGF